MDKIVKTYLLLSIFCLCMVLSSCKDIEHVFLINKTSETISIKVTLVTLEGEQIMETDIAPNESDGWEFEVNKGDKKILVTGGAGFIGSNLIKRLLEIGEKVICLDNFYTGTDYNISTFKSHPNFTCIQHDITEKIDL